MQASLTSNCFSFEATQYRSPTTTPNITKTAEIESEESLQTLHAKLQEETEKIVQWKVATEFIISQKERQLNDSQKTIQTLRSNLVEQQLNSEHLSLSLLQEKKQREIIEEQATRTRHLCSVLKEHQSELQTSLNELSSVRDNMQNFNDEVREEINKIKLKFSELSSHHENVIEELASKGNEVNDLKKERDDLIYQLSLKDSEVISAKNASEFKDVINLEYAQNIFKLEERLESTSAHLKWDMALVQKESLFHLEIKKEKEDKILILESKITELEKRLQTEAERLRESRNEFEEAAEKVKQMTRCISVLEGSKDEISLQLESVRELKKDLEMKLEYTCKNLEEIAQVSAENEKHLEKINGDLDIKLNTIKGEMEKKNEDIEKLTEKCEELERKVKLNEKCFEEEKDLYEKKLATLLQEKASFSEQVSEAENKFLEILKEREHENFEFDAFKERFEDTKEKLTASDREISFLREEIDSLKSVIKDKEILLGDALEAKKNMLGDKDLLLKEKETLNNTLNKVQEDYYKLGVDLQATKKSLNVELKKNDKLKTRIQKLEAKIKDGEASYKTETRTISKSLEELKKENSTLMENNNELNKSLEELKISKENLETSYQCEIDKFNEKLKESQDKIKESEEKATLSEMEADSKIKEIMDLSECWKRDSEAVIKIKDNEISKFKMKIEDLESTVSAAKSSEKELIKSKVELDEIILNKDKELRSMQDQLKEKINEYNSLQAAIKQLSGSPKTALHTPSPSEYLPLYRSEALSNKFANRLSNIEISSVSPTESERAIEDGMKPSKTSEVTTKRHVMQNSGILKSNLLHLQVHRNKNVSFGSPIVSNMPDSDSSEGFAIEISDNEEKFETVKRSSNIRQTFSEKRKGIPKANIQPFSRSCDSSVNQQSNARKAGTKRLRYDKSAVRTYSSPKDKKTEMRNEHRILLPPPDINNNQIKLPRDSLQYETIVELTEKEK